MKRLITIPKSNQHALEKRSIVRHWAERQRNHPKVAWGMLSQALSTPGQIHHPPSLNISFEPYGFGRFILIIRSLTVIVFVVLKVTLEKSPLPNSPLPQENSVWWLWEGPSLWIPGDKQILQKHGVLPICCKGGGTMGIKKLEFSLGTGKGWRLEPTRGRAYLAGIVFT